MSKYISLENLERYDAKMQERIASFCASKEDGMWRQTEKAGAVQFWPVGNSPLEGTVEFLFKETPPASGEKSPDNPSTISGMSNITVKRVGANLLRKYSRVEATNYTCNGDGTYTIHASPVNNANTSGANSARWQLIALGFPNGRYTLRFKESNATCFLVVSRFVNGVSQGYPSITGGQSYTFEITDETTYINIYFQFTGGHTYNETVTPVLTLEGVEEIDVCDEASATISLGGTYYGGSLDLATGLMTVKSQKVAIDGSCSYDYLGGLGNESGFVAVVVTIYALEVTKGYFVTGSCTCSRFPVFSTETPKFTKAGMFLANPNLSYFNYKQVRFYLSLDMLGLSSSATQQEVASAAKAWFTANPADAVFTFAEPFSTVQLTPLQIRSLIQPDKYVPRLNTVYSDAENVQIVYQKNPVRDKFEKVQAIIAQGGNV